MEWDRLDGVAADVASVLAQAWEAPAPVVVEEVTPFGDGHSGFTYRLRVTRDGQWQRLILRLSPPGARIVGPSDVGLQGRVMSAVGAHGVPVPAVIACSSEPTIDGRAFVLMEEVHGHRWDEQSDLDDMEVVEAALGALIRMRSVPIAASGLDVAAARDARAEVMHWRSLLPRCADDLRQVLDPAADSLLANAPSTPATHVVHGDYHFGNLLFDGRRIAAVFDWEIASLGDPLFDMAGLVVAAMRARYAPEPNPTGSVQVTPAEIAYHGGVDESLFAWYVAASCFKYAAILGYNDRLHRLGKRVDPIYDELQTTMRGLAHQAGALG